MYMGTYAYGKYPEKIKNKKNKKSFKNLLTKQKTYYILIIVAAVNKTKQEKTKTKRCAGVVQW